MKLTNNFLLLPPTTISISEILLSAGRTAEEVEKTIATTGIRSVHHSESKGLTQFVFEGLLAISEKHQDVLVGVDAIIVVSQTYDERIPSISTRIQRKYNLPPNTFCIDIMDGCSGYIKALALARMLEVAGYQRVLIVAGDLNSLITANADIGTKILFGDGLSVTILESDEHELDVQLFNNGDQEGVISCSSTDNLMNMNGFEVFRFTRNMVPPLIREYLESTNKTLDSFDLVALHQASKLVVSTMCASLKIKNALAKDFSCGEIGNLGAGSIGAWLASISDLTSKGKLNMLAVGFGSGLSWGLASVVVDVKRNEVFYV
jgi:3-oxoacyl-[acyl-carrier-protein] synthase-3